MTKMVCAVYSESACVDYAHVAALAKQAGLANVHECPQDGISGVACRERPRQGMLKNVADVTASHLNWSHVLVYMLVGGAGAKKDASRNKVRDWWLERLPRDVSLDVVLIGDALMPTSGQKEDLAVDFASSMQSALQAAHPNHKFHLVRALPEVDAGYFRLACKTVTGMMRILDMTKSNSSSAATVMSSKRFFLKIDDDTALLPSRLLSFLQTIDATTLPSSPVYFGTILNDHKHYLLCDELAWDERTPNATNPIYLFSQKGKDKDKDKEEGSNNNKGIVPICYAQGGAYGMNAAAFALFANTHACTREMDLESTGEDAYVGYRIYKESKSMVIHCGSFRPHTSSAREVWKDAFSFHHASNLWLQLATNLTLANPD